MVISTVTFKCSTRTLITLILLALAVALTFTVLLVRVLQSAYEPFLDHFYFFTPTEKILFCVKCYLMSCTCEASSEQVSLLQTACEAPLHAEV